MRIIAVAAIVVCFIIGLPTILVGCNSFYPVCVHYYLYPNAIIVDVSIETKQCSYCAVTNTDGTCSDTEYYDCYSPAVTFSKNNSTCRYSEVKAYDEVQKARDAAAQYHIGDERTVYVEKRNEGVCTADVQFVKNLSIVGITFLALGGLIGIVWIGCELLLATL